MSKTTESSAKRLAGVIVPVVTPVDDKGSLDERALGRTINHIIDKGAHGIFVLGSTGEFASLTREQHIEVIKSARTHVPEEFLFTVGISCCCLADGIAASRTAADLGADYVVSTAPYYQLYGQEEIQAYFRELASASPTPLILYNLPDQTGVALEAATVLALSEHPNIVGLKESASDLANLVGLCSAMADRNDFALLSGRGNYAAQGLLYGVCGLVPALGNLIPDRFRQLYDAAQAGDFSQVMSIQHSINRLYVLFAVGRSYDPKGGPTSLKVALSLMGLCGEQRVQLHANITDAFREQVATLLRSCELPIAEEAVP